MPPTIHIFPDLNKLSLLAAELFLQAAQEAVARNGRFLAALSGGGTPQAVYRLLSQPPYADQLPWAQTHLFWGDERLVPPDDPESCYGMTAHLLLNHVPIPPENIHRARGEVDVATAVADYQHQLAQWGNGSSWPCFDLVLLGMGHDGHTASLFPGPIHPKEKITSVISAVADYDGRPAQRISLTPAVFNDGRHILFLATGEKKAKALFEVLEGRPNPETWPAQRIVPRDGRVTWLVDRAAAALLEGKQ